MSARSVRAAFLLGLLLAGPASAQEYIRDEIRLNMRAGPGVEFKILKVLKSGDSVTRLARQKDWVQVRTEDGRQGWLPTGYTTSDAPARVVLAGVRAELAEARQRIEQLDQALEVQAGEIGEMQELRRRNREMEAELSRLDTSLANWRWMVAGAVLLALGLGAGLLVARLFNLGSRHRGRLKL
ncbi:MAG: TIGR04211 family SH3 domain-containing protein [Proteobacteria bacterium]|nr:TIGR04211 family SH3 domain-containing protein [Pseudomonadota bacterium]